jgi:hypothetical protein
MQTIERDDTAANAIHVDLDGRVTVSEIFAEYLLDAAFIATLAICFFV